MIISFLGDISFNGGYEQLARKGASPFRMIEEDLKKSDLVIGNLECLVYGKKVNELKKPRLGTSPETYSFLKDLKVDLVTLAHNHVHDHLLEGFQNTTYWMDKLKISYIGASENLNQRYIPYITKNNGLKIGFLNYVTEDTNPSLPPNHKIYPNIYNEEKVKNHVYNLKPLVDYVVLLLHWAGRHEGSYYPQHDQRLSAKRLIDHGVDLIVGHHSHTVQPFEYINGKYVFYSIGNFCFDNITSDNRIKFLSKKNKKGVILKINFSKDRYDFSLAFIRNRQLEIQKGNQIQRF